MLAFHCEDKDGTELEMSPSGTAEAEMVWTCGTKVRDDSWM